RIGLNNGAQAVPRGQVEMGSGINAALDAINANIANGIVVSDSTGGNIAAQIMAIDSVPFRFAIQGRNAVGANNIAYPVTVNELGGGVFIGSFGTPLNLSGQTANVAATTIYTTAAGTGPTAAGMYRVCATAWATVTGNSTVTINAVAPSGAGTVTFPFPQTL